MQCFGCLSNMGRSPNCCSIQELNRGIWTKKEDMILSEHIRIHGNDGNWTKVPKEAGLKRTGKSCRLRWLNYLRPDIIRGNISPDEDELIIRLHRLLGNRWSLIAGRLPGRTDNEIKNYWNTHLSKKQLSMNDSQTNSTAQSVNTKSKSLSPLRNHTLKTTPVRHSEMATPNGSNLRNGSSSNEACKLSIVKETPKVSKSCCDLLANNSSMDNAFAMVDVNLLEAEGKNSISTMSTLEDEESRPYSDNFAEDAAINLAQSLSELNELLSPHRNILFSASDFSTDFALEGFYRPGTATEMNEFDDIMCSDQSNMQCVNNPTVGSHDGMEEFYDNMEHVNWIHDLEYLHHLDS